MPFIIFAFLCLLTSPAFALEEGDNLPDISGVMDKKSTSLLALQEKNKPMVIGFFSVTCIPCIREAPELEEIRVAFQKKGVRFIYVNLDPETAAKQIISFQKKTKTKIPIFYADVEAVKKKYEAYGMPKLILIDGAKKITQIYEGYHPDLKDLLTEKIKALLI